MTTRPLADYSVAELMHKSPHTIKESATLLDAIRVMNTKKVTSLIVEKEHDKDAFGILTSKDILFEVGESGEDLSALHVSDLATKPVITVQAALGVKQAIRMMRLSGVRRLVVLDGDRLAGVISNTDIFKVLLNVETSL